MAKTFMKFVQKKDTTIAESTVEIMQDLLSVLKAQDWNYQTTHWQVEGDDYYGNHLMFQRLYESLGAEIDTLGEKIVAYFGSDKVDSNTIITKTHEWIEKWKSTSDFIKRAILSEEDMQKMFKSAYDKLKESDDLSLGLDDFLMATANAHETNLYLLGQV